MSETRPFRGQFYSYLWLRADGTPYYAGKGKDRRAFIRESHRCFPPIDRNRILIFPQPSEADAFESEIALIDLFGRKDLGTGCLRNFTNGGEGSSGRKPTDGERQKNSEAQKGNQHHLGFLHSDETKLRMSHAARGRKKTAKHRARIGEASHAFWTLPDNRLRRSIAAKQQWAAKKAVQHGS